MTILDNGLRVSTAQSLIGAGPIVSAKSIDLAALDIDGTTVLSKPDQGIGRQLVAQIVVPTDLDLATSMLVEIIIAEDTALVTNPIVVGSTGAIPLADWNNQNQHPILVRINPNPELANMDPNDATSKRYMGLRYTEVGTNPTAGTVTADFVLDPHAPQRHYPSKMTVA